MVHLNTNVLLHSLCHLKEEWFQDRSARDHVTPFTALVVNPSGENLQHFFALFFPSTARTGSETEESGGRERERAGEESSFVTENLLRLSIIFNRENKSFDSIIRGISCLPRGPPTSGFNEREKTVSLSGLRISETLKRLRIG